jgi:F-type H+-transporting ATPase subunit b
MSINATLIAQIIAFLFFVWFTMKFIWPPVTSALAERQAKIAEGLSSAERGHRELELAQTKATEMMRDAKLEVADIIEKAHKQAAILVEESKDTARREGERLMVLAKEDIAQEVNNAKQALRDQVAVIAIRGAEKIIDKNLDDTANRALVDKLIEEL